MTLMSRSRSSASETALWANPSMFNVSLLSLTDKPFVCFLKALIVSFQAYGEIPNGWIVSFDVVSKNCMIHLFACKCMAHSESCQVLNEACQSSSAAFHIRSDSLQIHHHNQWTNCPGW